VPRLVPCRRPFAAPFSGPDWSKRTIALDTLLIRRNGMRNYLARQKPCSNFPIAVTRQ
jgi:hypothetical protein